MSSPNIDLLWIFVAVTIRAAAVKIAYRLFSGNEQKQKLNRTG